MASIKIVLRQKQKKDGTFPLAIRITKDRKHSFIHLGQSVKSSEWDSLNQRVKKSHPNSQRLNNYLLKKLAESNDHVLELETVKNEASLQAFRQVLKPGTRSASFFRQAEAYLANLRVSGKYNRFSADKPRIQRFKEFLKGSDISFRDITVSVLDSFRTYLKSTRKINERTVVNHLVVVRTIFNLAIKQSIVDRKYYPFGAEKIRIKFPDSHKIGLTADEVKAIEELKLEKSSLLNHARNLWLFSFYFAGMRVSDVLRLSWSDFKNDRLHYTMGKNAKSGSLKVPEKALKILSQYRDQQSGTDCLVFPDLKMLEDMRDKYEVQKKIANAVKKVDALLPEVAKLAGIDKPLTMHIARHTFGNISGEKIPIQMLQKLYRHSSITTTIGYQANFAYRETDEALDSVLDF